MIKGITQNLFKRQRYMVLSEESRVPKTETGNPIVLGLWSRFEVRSFASRQLGSLPWFAVYILASAPLHTQDTEIGLGALVCQPQPTVWVPWCDSRNRASQYQIEAASWQRRADRMRAEWQDRRWRQGASGMEKERAGEEERTERPSSADNQMLPIWTVRHGASGADRIRHYYNREGKMKS